MFSGTRLCVSGRNHGFVDIPGSLFRGPEDLGGSTLGYPILGLFSTSRSQLMVGGREYGFCS